MPRMTPQGVQGGSAPILEAVPERQRSIDTAFPDVRLTSSTALRASNGT